MASVSPRALLWRSALAVAAVAAVFFMWECHSALVANRQLANAAAHNFHTEFNEGKYQEIFEQADYGFTYDKTETELAQALQAIRTKLGTANASELVGIRIDDTTSGRTFVTAQYETSFTRAHANETFTWLKAGNTLSLYRYHVLVDKSHR